MRPSVDNWSMAVAGQRASHVDPLHPKSNRWLGAGERSSMSMRRHVVPRESGVRLMSIAALAALSLKASLLLIVLSTGMSGRRGDIVALLRSPGLLLRSLASMLVIAPVLAVALATTRELSSPVKIALVMMAVSPVPPFLPGKELRAGGQRPYIISLLAISALLSIVTIPLTFDVLSRVFGLPLTVPAMAVAKAVGVTVLVPLVAGLILQRIAPAFCASWSRVVSIVGAVLLLVGGIA